MGIKIASHLAKNKIVRDTSGNIIDWFDEIQGGWIVQKRQVVNPGAWNAYIQKQKDKADAAKAASMPKVDPNAPDRTVAPSQEKKIKELEDKVGKMDDKLDAILKAIAK